MVAAKLKATAASLRAGHAQLKDKKAAQLKKLETLHAHCGDLGMAIQAEDSRTVAKKYKSGGQRRACNRSPSGGGADRRCRRARTSTDAADAIEG